MVVGSSRLEPDHRNELRIELIKVAVVQDAEVVGGQGQDRRNGVGGIPGWQGASWNRVIEHAHFG
jgi:hypothetical protein